MTALSKAVLSVQSSPGPQDSNQDRTLALRQNEDSWVIAVADGFGGNPHGGEAADAALAEFPSAIHSPTEMLQTANAANGRVLALSTETKIMNTGDNPLATLAVASWSSKGGLLVCSVGDSMVAVIPSVGARSRPLLIGAAEGRDDAGALESALGLNQPLENRSVRILEVNFDLAHNAVAVICATDGAWEAMISGLLDTPTQAWADLLQTRPERAASSLIGWAGEHGFTDDASAAVAVVPL